MARDLKNEPEFAWLSTQASKLTVEQLYDKSVEAWERAQAFGVSLQVKAAGPKDFESDFSRSVESDFFRRLSLESQHQYPTDVERRQLEILQTREAIWGLLYDERKTRLIMEQESALRDQTIEIPIGVAGRELQKNLPQALVQAVSELERAYDHSWSDKDDERRSNRS